jgi:putative ABC transport system ATP-binding protein
MFTVLPMIVDDGYPDRQPLVEVQELVRTYRLGAQEVAALRGINLRVERGSFVALRGRSGSGKTTLLNCIGGLDRPSGGTVRVLGRSLASLTEQRLTNWRRVHVGFVFQSFALLPTLSAYENVELMLRMLRKNRRERHEQTLHYLEMVGLSKWMHHRPFELSGGQQQRVAIARALANAPQLILADEPTGELDSTTAREILALFRRIVSEEQTTLLLASHDPMVDEYADRVLQLRDGQIVAQD